MKGGECGVDRARRNRVTKTGEANRKKTPQVAAITMKKRASLQKIPRQQKIVSSKESRECHVREGVEKQVCERTITEAA